MEFKIVKYLSRLGQGTWVDSLSFLLSSRRFMILLWLLVFALVLLQSSASFVVIFFAFGLVVCFLLFFSEFVFKQVLAKLRGFRKRPYIAYPGRILGIGHLYTDASFPSSHMAGIVSLFVLAGGFVPYFFYLGIVFAVLMAFSRIHNGMHYLTDVLVGALL